MCCTDCQAPCAQHNCQYKNANLTREQPAENSESEGIHKKNFTQSSHSFICCELKSLNDKDK